MVKIHQISSATFLRPSAWVATVTSAAAIGRLESTYFYVEKIHKYHSSQRICFIFVLFIYIHQYIHPHNHFLAAYVFRSVSNTRRIFICSTYIIILL